MTKIPIALEAVALVVAVVLGILWFMDPAGRFEPLMSLVLLLCTSWAEFLRRQSTAVPTVIAWIFAVGAASIAGFIIFRWVNQREDVLEGVWDCNWNVEPNAGGYDGPNPIRDTVNFSAVTEDSVRGEGMANGYGRYPFSGENSPFSVAIAYRGTVSKNLTGVVLLVKTPDPSTEMHGRWQQLDGTGAVMGGEVSCSKQEQ